MVDAWDRRHGWGMPGKEVVSPGMGGLGAMFGAWEVELDVQEQEPVQELDQVQAQLPCWNIPNQPPQMTWTKNINYSQAEPKSST